MCSGRITWDLMVERAQAARARSRSAIAARRAALPAPGRGDQGRDRPLPEPQGDPLGAGRAGATWARGRTTSSTCGPSSTAAGRAGHPSGVAPRRRWARTQAPRRGAEDAAHEPGVRSSGRTRGEPDVLHRSRASRSSSSAGVTRRSPWRGSPSGCRSSSTSTRSSRRRSSGWPPGWPGSTTPRTT